MVFEIVICLYNPFFEFSGHRSTHHYRTYPSTGLTPFFESTPFLDKPLFFESTPFSDKPLYWTGIKATTYQAESIKEYLLTTRCGGDTKMVVLKRTIQSTCARSSSILTWTSILCTYLNFGQVGRLSRLWVLSFLPSQSRIYSDLRLVTPPQ